MPGHKGPSEAAPSSTPSREFFKFPVEKCKIGKRRDKFIELILNAEKYYQNGKALNPASGAFACNLKGRLANPTHLYDNCFSAF